MNGIERAISVVGSVTALSRSLGFPHASTVSNWRSAGVVPPDQSPAVEELTGVPCEDLTPTHEWTRDDQGRPFYRPKIAFGPASNDSEGG